MTREEAIFKLIEYRRRLERDFDGSEYTLDAEPFDMAIEALKQEPCEDCISRKEALECFEWTNTKAGARHAIETLRPALHTREKGKWIGGELGECSVCGHKGCASDIWTGCKGIMYCPNCGADMRGTE